MPWLHLSTDLPWCVQAKEKALKEAQKKLADAVKALAKANKDAADVAAKATKAASDKTKLFMGECRWCWCRCWQRCHQLECVPSRFCTAISALTESD